MIEYSEISDFIEKNNIEIFVEVDYKEKKFNIVKRDIMLESYDLFEQLIYFNSIDNLFESVRGQNLPRMWSQGKTKCIISQINDDKLVALFYDTDMDAKDNYFHAKQLDMQLKNVL